MKKFKRLPEPTPELVRRAREATLVKGRPMTQAEAAAVVHLGAPTRWGEYERDVYKMSMATWELFLIKTGQRDVVLATTEEEE